MIKKPRKALLNTCFLLSLWNITWKIESANSFVIVRLRKIFGWSLSASVDS
jgi:hypothetical protein